MSLISAVSATFRNGVGIIAVYTSMAALAFGLQWIPSTGVFFMMFGAALIVGSLIHICLLHLGVAAATGAIGRAWLAVPVAYYGGGYYLHLRSSRAVADRAAAIEKTNREQRFSVVEPFTYLAANMESLELLRRFRIAAAYRKEGSNRHPIYEKYAYAHGTDCISDRQQPHRSNRSGKPLFSDRDLFPSYTGADKTNQCILLERVPPPVQPEYEIRMRYGDSDSTVLYRESTLTWMALEAKTGKVVVATEAALMIPLPTVQFIVAGCALNSGSPRWECFASLMPGSEGVVAGFKKRTDHGNPFTPVVDVETSSWAALGHALGLTPRTPTD